MSDSTHIRDPLYGYIQLTPVEKRLLDTEDMQRLRRIRQLGLTDLVYPSATHTRLEHSIGVMYVASQFAESIGLDETETQVVRLAGLLHDVGHGPFSHASERLGEEHGIPHEELSCEIVEKHADKLPVDPDRINAHIRGTATPSIIAGTIDADRMDYLRRDSHKTGPEHGEVDTATIVEFATVEDGELVFDYKCLQALERFITARYAMMSSVYQHHATKISEAMLHRALEHYAETHAVRDILSMDDYELHTALLQTGGPAQTLYERVSNRRLYKRAFTLTENTVSRETLSHLEQTVESRPLEEEIAAEAGIDPIDVLVDPPTTPKETLLDVNVRSDGEVTTLQEASALLNDLPASQWQMVSMNVYAPAKHIDAVQDAAQDSVQFLVNDPS